ncbi:MAG: sigma 54-interacting transcriptional regulator [Deltaproteobacteria bacterium]|nr:sigma 54-interacting transcriptional regulator [Deltaproteobacteria bacterium]
MPVTRAATDIIFHEQLSQLLENLGIGVFTVDRDRRITSFNQTVQRLTGFSEEEVLGRQCYDVFYNDLCHGECMSRDDIQKAGRPQAFDMEIQDQKGNRHRITKLVSPLLTSDGRVSGCIEIFQDFSIFSELLERIRYGEHRLKLILDNLDIGIFTVNRSGHVMSFNSVAETITGYKRREILGQHHAKFMGCDRPEVRCLLNESIKTGKKLADHHSHLVTKDGLSLPIRVSFLALRNESGQIVGGLGTFQDISLIQQLNRAISKTYTLDDMVGKDGLMQQIFEIVPVVAASEANVLIEGATGTGKDLLAKVIHKISRRKDKPFVKVNCAALPDSLLESEMFGYVKGAFTGADQDKPGRFQEADGGTIFLDEIGDLPLSLQAKLLRVLEDREFYPLGGRKLTRVDVRIIAATNQGLERLVRERRFREDLYYRLHVMRLELPPLNKRRGDIPLLIDRFIRRYNATKGTAIGRVSEQAMDGLLNYQYPGNIRELENIMEHACILCQGSVIEWRHLPKYLRVPLDQNHHERPATEWQTSEHGEHDQEKRQILTQLRQNQWHRQKTARALGIDRTTLWRKMKKHNIVP